MKCQQVRRNLHNIDSYEMYVLPNFFFVDIMFSYHFGLSPTKKRDMRISVFMHFIVSSSTANDFYKFNLSEKKHHIVLKYTKQVFKLYSSLFRICIYYFLLFFFMYKHDYCIWKLIRVHIYLYYNLINQIFSCFHPLIRRKSKATHLPSQRYFEDSNIHLMYSIYRSYTVLSFVLFQYSPFSFRHLKLPCIYCYCMHFNNIFFWFLHEIIQSMPKNEILYLLDKNHFFIPYSVYLLAFGLIAWWLYMYVFVNIEQKRQTYTKIKVENKNENLLLA